MDLFLCLPGLQRLLISPIRRRSGICPSQWEPRQRRGGRCLWRDMKRWRTAMVPLLLSDTCSILTLVSGPSCNIPSSHLLYRWHRWSVGSLPLLHPLLLRYHRGVIPGQDGAVLQHLPNPPGETVNTTRSTAKLTNSRTDKCFSIVFNHCFCVLNQTGFFVNAALELWCVARFF